MLIFQGVLLGSRSSKLFRTTDNRRKGQTRRCGGWNRGGSGSTSTSNVRDWQWAVQQTWIFQKHTHVGEEDTDFLEDGIAMINRNMTKDIGVYIYMYINFGV